MEEQIDNLAAKRDKYKSEKRKNMEYISKIKIYEKQSKELIHLNNFLGQRVQSLESQVAQKDLQIEELDAQSKAASEFDRQNMSIVTSN